MFGNVVIPEAYGLPGQLIWGMGGGIGVGPPPWGGGVEGRLRRFLEASFDGLDGAEWDALLGRSPRSRGIWKRMAGSNYSAVPPHLSTDGHKHRLSATQLEHQLPTTPAILFVDMMCF